MNWLSAAIGCVLLMQSLNANAQTVYVDDRLQVGLHSEPTLTSPITELLSSGTELQLVERAGALARVRTSAGVEGWVDGSFISSVQPARARVQAMEAELAGAQAALADLQAKLVVLEQRPEQVASERAADQSATLPSEALREMQLLAQENQRLKQQLAELEAVLRMEQERTATASPSGEQANNSELPVAALGIDGEFVSVQRLKYWQLILLASVLLLAFSLGGWLVDWGIRRRHGGFRV